MIEKLVIATGNAGKLREIRHLLEPLGIKVVPQSDFNVPEAEEPHCTFIENALAKARHASRITGLPALADDSGICVDALGGAPGVHSAIYAGVPRCDARNNEKLQQALQDSAHRNAHYHCVMVLVRRCDDPAPLIAEGEWHGVVLNEARGGNGFGYDPYFLDPQQGKTGAELSLEIKNRISHRGKALAILLEKNPECPILIQLQELPPLSLYVHIPWCVRKCPYCDFNSHETREEAPQQAYVEAVIRDLEQALPLVWGCRIHTVFFGGGTPSLLQPDLLDHLLSQLRALLPLAVNAEITLEANPGTVDASRFAQFKASGVNRLSLGIQSFNNHSLQRIGRIHDAAQAITAAELALQTFDRVNLDLMYALPQQTMEMALADIQQAIALKPQHISAYHLTLEPNTLFHHQPPPLPDDDTSAAMQQAIEDSLVAAGYARYEISAFAVPGQACRHNLNYWQFGDYLGIGAGAHSKLSFPDHILRQARYKHPTAYMQGAEKGAPVENAHKLSRADLGFEFMMNALRLTDGFPVALFQQRTGLPISCVDAALNQAEKRGLLTRDYLRIAPSLMGQRFLNELLQLFLQD